MKIRQQTYFPRFDHCSSSTSTSMHYHCIHMHTKTVTYLMQLVCLFSARNKYWRKEMQINIENSCLKPEIINRKVGHHAIFSVPADYSAIYCKLWWQPSNLIHLFPLTPSLLSGHENRVSQSKRLQYQGFKTRRSRLNCATAKLVVSAYMSVICFWQLKIRCVLACFLVGLLHYFAEKNLTGSNMKISDLTICEPQTPPLLMCFIHIFW